MKKMPCLFVRHFEGQTITIIDEVTIGCEWVLRGEGIATRKFNGTSCLVKDGTLFKRYDAKKGKTPPDDFVPAQPQPDATTKHWPGWVNVTRFDKYHNEAFAQQQPLENGTYELCGPKVQGNPEGLETHILVRHGAEIVENCPRTFEGLRNFMKDFPHEGIVFHNDGEMCKIRRNDFW